ncbi:MAG: glutamate-1-semialdehyde 2,1-aminomutase [Thermoplasmata archaeon]|nr:glutamate-1-semialdehyde 2,1-aminomutase [Thermoplasmata archaeon]
MLPGGVDSPVRSFVHVGGVPVFFARGDGARLVDVDGHRYLDLVNSWGAIILGHAAPSVVRAIERTAREGLSFGAPSPREHELAEQIRHAAPELERLRFVNSGTEATMSAVRVARGFTGRAKIVKFAGGYHGHSDGLLARAGSGVAAQSLPDSAGVPAPTVATTLVAPYNDLDATREVFEEHGEEIAAVIVEPIAANMGLVPPVDGFLRGVDRLVHTAGGLLIADEVITGFRLRRGLIHPTLGARADLVALGKIIGGGLPVAAYGGRRDVMETVAPIGPVYQAGTLAGNPVAMAAGTATLARLTPALYDRLDRVAAEAARSIQRCADGQSVDGFTLVRRGSMLGLFFADHPPRNEVEAARTDRARFARFFHAALDAGVYLPPSPLETAFLSAAWGRGEVADLERRLAGAFRAARRSGR